MNDLETQVLHTIYTRQLIQKGECVLLLVSGGRDSLALLHIMHALQIKLEITLHILHYDHGVRAESKQEATWVKQHVNALSLPFHLRIADHLNKVDAGFQAKARSWRRNQAYELLTEMSGDKIVTAHQQDDQVETLLMQWLRGVHLLNWQGIGWKRNPWIHPLLDIPRHALTAYLQNKKLDWLDDPSNQNINYWRNDIRLQLLPLLQKYSNGKLTTRLLHSAEQSEQIKFALTHLLPPPETLLCNSLQSPSHWIAIPPLIQLPFALQSMTLHQFIEERLPGSIDFAHWQTILNFLNNKIGPWKIDIPKKRQLSRVGDKLFLIKQ